MNARTLISFAVVGSLVAALAVAQPPKPASDPPALLPPSITGRPYDPVSPASATSAKAAPADRFKVPGHPDETLAAVESATDAAAWLVRLCKADGRFVPGIDPTLKRELGGAEMGQAFAALAVARAAKFTGDPKQAAIAAQACLTLLTLTKPDAKQQSVRVPTVAAERCNPVGFAAVLAMAIYDQPNPDAKLTAQADELCRYLYSRLRTDGSVQTTDAAKPDAQAVVAVGLCFQALMASDRVTPEQWKRDALARGVTFYREPFKTEKNTEGCAALLPAVCDYALRAKSEPATAFALELADTLCDRQYSRTDARNLRWVGGVKPTDGDEPTAATACCVQAFAAAVTLAANVPDVTRHARYKTAARSALVFARSLQWNESNGDHFERTFRTRWLSGGVFGSPTDGLVRAEHTAHLLTAELRFLESGAEKAE